MKSLLVILAIIFCAVIARSEAPTHYYDAAAGTTGPPLRQALHKIISHQSVLPYPNTVAALQSVDEDPANTNNVILMYSGWSAPKSAYGSGSGTWNREHLWPQSYGASASSPLSDLFNLRPCDSGANSSRGNKFYDFADRNDRNFKAPAYLNAPLCLSDTDSWELPTFIKGDVARALFYMDVRYDAADGPDLRLTDDVATILTGANRMGRLGALLRWHQLDTVDAAEQIRNDRVFAYQYNRNPFIDHPEWVEPVFCPALAITIVTNSVRFAWSPDWPNAIVEAATDLSGSWLPYVPAPAEATNALRFFRLRLQ